MACTCMGEPGRDLAARSDFYLKDNDVAYRGDKYLDLAQWTELYNELKSKYEPLERSIQGALSPVHIDPVAQAEQDRNDQYEQTYRSKLSWFTRGNSASHTSYRLANA